MAARSRIPIRAWIRRFRAARPPLPYSVSVRMSNAKSSAT